MSTQEFELEGTSFRVERLKVKASLAGLKLVGKVLLPALAEAHSAPPGQVGAAVEKAVEGLDCLPELLDLFAPRTKFQKPGVDLWIALPTAVDDVFEGRPDLTVQYLVKCVQGEYGSFLAGSGPLAQLAAKVAAKVG
jgi:hypothetical protein